MANSGAAPWSLAGYSHDKNLINFAAAPIPEPSAYGLFLGGLALAGAALRRRRQALRPGV